MPKPRTLPLCTPATVRQIWRLYSRQTRVCPEEALSNIRPNQVHVVNLHPEFRQLLVIHVELDPAPSPLWVQLFHDFRDESHEPPGFAPLVRDGAVELHPADAHVETFLLALERRIRHVNVHHAAVLGRAEPAKPPRRRDTIELLADGFSVEVLERILHAREAAERVSGMFRAQEWQPLEITNLNQPPTRDTLLDLEAPRMNRGPKPKVAVADTGE